MKHMRESFEKWARERGWSDQVLMYSEEYMCYFHPVVVAAWDAWQASSSVLDDEPVAWAVFAGNGNIRIWGREKPGAFPDAVPLYLNPTIKESLTAHSDPIGYADLDSLSDYRNGERLHIPVYRTDASSEWQNGIPVYLWPAQPVQSRSETQALYEFARELDDMLECMTREEAKMGLRLAIQEAVAKADRLRTTKTEEK